MHKVLFIIVTVLLLNSCGKVKEITSALMDLRQIEFSLASIEDVRFSGISLNNNTSISDLSAKQILSLVGSFNSNKILIDFTLNVEARNPNESKGRSITTNARITDFPYDLLINDKIILSGNIKNEVTVPASGTIVTIPLSVSFNMYEFYKARSYEDLYDLALNIANFNTDEVNIKVIASPSVATQLGDLSPGRITIVNKDV